ncbi:MAG: hypothetical protein ACTSX7_12205 [Alphaproteobacteria bacterium]
MKGLTKIGFWITAGWVTVFVALAIWNGADTLAMDPNEWGDFLAGFSAPLALIWLVIGFFLQGKELHLNTEALKLQQEELRRQVEETARLAQNSDRQAKAAETMALLAKAEREAKPRLLVEDVKEGDTRLRSGTKSPFHTVHLMNVGADARAVKIYDHSAKPVHEIQISAPRDLWLAGKVASLTIIGEPTFPFDVTLEYLDKIDGTSGFMFLRFSEKGVLVDEAKAASTSKGAD